MTWSNTKKASYWRSEDPQQPSLFKSVATTDADTGSPPEEPVEASQQPAKKKSRAGRDLPAAIAVGTSIGAVLIATLLWAPHFWVLFCSGAALLASHEVVRRLREAGYLIPVIPLLIGGQATVWLTWPYRAVRCVGRLRLHGRRLHDLAPFHARRAVSGRRGCRWCAAVDQLPA